jgi:hypothetical protein
VQVIILRKLVLFKIGSKDAQLPKLIGAFLIVISVLMLIQSGAVMFDSWHTIRGFDECVDDAYSLDTDATGISAVLSELKYQDCKESFQEITGAQVPGNQKYLTSRQKWTAFLTPVSVFFAWAIVFLFALFLFNSATVVVPVEELELNLSKPRKTKKTKRK